MIDLRPVGYVVGMMVGGLGASMAIPMLVDLLYGNGHWAAFAVSSFLSVVIGASLTIACANGVGEGLTIRQTFMLVTGLFLVLPAFGALPFFLGATDSRIVDSFFESMSGFTTTGATVLTGLSLLPEGLLLWRGMLQWFGGAAIVVVTLVFLPFLRVGGMQLFRWESYDTLGNILPRAAEMARSISLIYLVLSVCCALGYSFAGMTAFDAIVHSMTTVATGGFGNYDSSFGEMGARAEYVGVAFMILASLPFIRYVQFVNGTWQPFFEDSQIRAFLLITIVIVALLGLWQFAVNGQGWEAAFRKSLFNGVSILTGTGYASEDYGRWGTFPVAIFFVVGLIGGCAGSTSCSIKVFRYQLLIAAIISQFKRIKSPHAVVMTRYGKQKVPPGVISSVLAFFVVFFASLVVISILLAMSGLDFITSASGSVSTLANIGPGLGDQIGPAGNYSQLNDFAKWVLSAAMLIGRLELISVFAILSVGFWQE